ncbi:putative HSP20-like chaperone [Rosa chinensis]|uniref:Putative HSP20-like chaperone n=1 Tax=Rosa chinensis TaxID=74649 RepID=A0A2P6SM91_ROSCH|nr:putative HSP20-like chaperone [Rosa chinensis]
MAFLLSQTLRRVLFSGDHLFPAIASRSISTTASASMRYHIFMADRNDPNDKGPLPAVQIRDSDDSFTVTRAFPGFGKEIVKVAVDVEKNTVSIKLRDCDGCETLVPLPEGCKSGEARSEVKHGMVTVVVPKRKKGEE